MSALHPLVAGFAADVYDRGRPGYGREVTDVLAEELGLAPGARVLDLGAGTGKLSRALLDAGFDVVAVEPMAEMRKRLARAIGEERALEGRAEAIPLPDSSVQAVTMADCFHWFDQRPAIEEIRRALAPGGGLAILWTAPSWTGDWTNELGELMAELRSRHPMFIGDPRGIDELFAEAGGFAPLRRRAVDVPQDFDRDAVLAYVASWSWVGALAPPDRSAVLEQVVALLDRQGLRSFGSAVHTELFLTRLL